ncbi:MAG: cytochrome c [Lewinellaceae bacterium]|nr:cytochrome c [Phaeodactylibacter sp.]MCB9039043.1 cytochrome c [Lewinellaceae bacterium]
MKQWFVFLALAVFALACGNSENEGQLAANAGIAQKPDGEKIYKQYCVTCHGIYGDMGAAGAYNLRETQLSLEERVAVITKGRNAMTPFETLLKKKEIKAVAEYVATLGEK